MSSDSSSHKLCILEPNESKYKTITLIHDEEVSIGRTIDLSIDDIRVSRKQVVVIADLLKEEVSIKRKGRNPSFLDGSVMKIDVLYKARHNSVLELVENGCKYRVKFDARPNLPTKNFCIESIDSRAIPPPAKRMKNCNVELFEVADGYIEWLDTKRSILSCKYGNVSQSINDVNNRGEKFRVAAFDLDTTLIKTKSGNIHPRGPEDWVLWHSCIPSALKILSQDGFIVVIISNQASLKFQDKVKAFKSKVEAILKTLKVPMVVMISTNHDFHRKPAPGMWFYLTDSILGGVGVDMEKSFYVGDAAGRITGWKPGKPKDFSISDRLFARNVDLKFYTPEEYFLKEKPGKFSEPNFVPSDYQDGGTVVNICGQVPVDHQPEVVVMVGLQGSGKSTFAKSFLTPKGYVHVNRDTLGTAAKCEKLLRDSLSARKKVVVDNTNVDLDSRKKIISICQQYNVDVRCFVMDASFQRCQHNNIFRIIKNQDHAIITPMVMRATLSKFVHPTKEEGFKEIVKVPFIPSFKSEEDRKLYNYHLLVFK